MHATNGSAVSFRSRIRLIGCFTVVALALSALGFATTASAASKQESYLALGDSLAFGYSQQLFNENEPKGEPAKAFEHGYASDYWRLLQAGGAKERFTNNGCPGETTGSLIGNGPLGQAMAGALGTTTEAPCLYHYLANWPLHPATAYGAVADGGTVAGTPSQLESALAVIAESAHSRPVTTLSINIGANDELHAIGKCEAEVKAEFEATGTSKFIPEARRPGTPTEAVKNCITRGVRTTFTGIITNLVGTLYVIRHASSFGGVDYTGKIIFDGAYDPFGRVYCFGLHFPSATQVGLCPAEPPFPEELLASSNALTFLLRIAEEEAFENPAIAPICATNPQPVFNPVVVGSGFPGIIEEPALLQKYTNMNNTTTSNGKANGPDIHPTPVGYEVLAGLMLNSATTKQGTVPCP
jgi:hypothetical protein